jgi:UDP-N-acetylmuramoyl-L-alanyl-D-glutamate--2,6-diaminopimelate ligase
LNPEVPETVVKVRDLVGNLEERGEAKIVTGGEREITGLTTDSRKVRPGDLFAALEGPRRDGHRFLSAAAAAGAAALMVESRREGGDPLPAGTALVEVDRVRDLLGEVADRYYGHPSGDLDLIGVTGTNGKTSVTYLLEAIFRAAGKKTGVIGTVEYRWDGRREAAPCTTPEAHDLQRMLRLMADDGVGAVAMEVSSHALAQHRILGCSFHTAIFTNLSRDHLDFHRDLEEYFLAKSRLFHDLRPGVAVINGDDPWGERILGEMTGKAVSYGRREGSDYRALEVQSDTAGIRMVLRHAGGDLALRSPLLGEHNVSNILAAAAAAGEYGLDGADIRTGIAAAGLIPGRFEQVSREGEPMVLVDYAHTPDALEHALGAARGITTGDLIVVFGCGGDRDRGKRPLMGDAAARLADRTFLTSDNPRGEDPALILGEIEKGFREAVGGRSRLDVVPDRSRAIGEAIAAAGPGDVVLIAGKGHEDYQVHSGRTVPFSDREEARRALEEREK